MGEDLRRGIVTMEKEKMEKGGWSVIGGNKR